MTIRSQALTLLESLKAAGVAPKVIERVPLGELFFYTVYDKRPEATISSEVYAGAHPSEEIAFTKALVEMVERRAFLESYENQFIGTQTDSTDGLAAWPIIGISEEEALERARDNAWHEALERFVWASWWDTGTKARITSFAPSDKASHHSTFIMLCSTESQVDVSEWISVEPAFEAQGRSYVQIYFAKLKGGGFISGGAAGSIESQSNVELRALAELLRHALAYKKLCTLPSEQMSFYERRLLHFASGKGQKLVETRINQSSNVSLLIPDLAIDVKVPHSLEHLVAVWRCYFLNQPPFVGGELERLCL